MLYRPKRQPWWLIALVFVFSTSSFFMLRSGRIDDSVYYLYVKWLVIPTIFVKLFAFSFGALMLVMFIEAAFFIHTGKLIVTREGASFESSRPSWWPLNKSASLLWSDVKSVDSFEGRGNKGIILRSSKGDITIARSHFGDFEKIVTEIEMYLKK